MVGAHGETTVCVWPDLPKVTFSWGNFHVYVKKNKKRVMEELDRGSSQFFLYTVVVTLPWMNFPGVVDFTKQTELCLLRPQGFLSTQHWIFRNEMLYYLIKSRGKQISIQETAVAAQSVYICSSLFQRLHSNFPFLGNLYCRPELFRYEDLLQNDNHTNLEHAFTVANKEFSVPTLLDPSGEA